MSQAIRLKADDTQYAVRRIPPYSNCWRPHPEKRITSGAFSGAEVSVDLYDSIPTVESLKSDYASFIQNNGVGLAISEVRTIRSQ